MAEKNYFGQNDLMLLVQLIYTETNKYQLKVEGKGLSEEDFTTALKNKLDGIADNAEVNVQADWDETDTDSDAYIQNKPDLAGTYAPIVNPTLTGSVKVPTAADGADTLTAVNIAYLNAALSAITGIVFDADTTGQGYASLADLQTKHPTGEAGHIYLVKNSGTSTNSFDEYFWNSASSSYERFGTTDVDLSGYLLKTDVQEMSTDDVQAIWDSVFGS